MIITKIEKQKRHPDRVNLYVDGEFAMGVHQEVIVKYGLRKGDSISKELIEELIIHEEYTLAKQKALRLINRRQRTEKEIRSKLIEKEFHPAVVDETIKHLKSIKLINDEAFARSYIHDALLKRALSRKYLKQQLQSKGVDKLTIEKVLDENFTQDQEIKIARKAAEKLIKRYQSSLKKIEPEKQYQRIAQYLIRRGFSWTIIVPILNKIFNNKTITQMEP